MSGKKISFVLKILFLHVGQEVCITKEWQMTADSEEQADALLAKYLADFAIRGWAAIRVDVVSATEVNDEVR